jgi:hypothetical protein
VALQVEGIVDGGVHAEETLGRSSRLEALQLALSSSHGLMRILCPIILPEPLLMPTGQSETAEPRGVGAPEVAGGKLQLLIHRGKRRLGTGSLEAARHGASPDPAGAPHRAVIAIGRTVRVQPARSSSCSRCMISTIAPVSLSLRRL